MKFLYLTSCALYFAKKLNIYRHIQRRGKEREIKKEENEETDGEKLRERGKDPKTERGSERVKERD
jgi:hypothetical protein